MDITYLNPNVSIIPLKIPLYPSACVFPFSTSASGLNPRHSWASSSFPMHTSTYFMSGFMMDWAFSEVQSFFRKLRSQETVTPYFFAAIQASRRHSADASEMAGVMPLQWNHCASFIMVSKSKSDGVASAMDDPARS